MTSHRSDWVHGNLVSLSASRRVCGRWAHQRWMGRHDEPLLALLGEHSS